MAVQSFPHNSTPTVNRGVAEAGWRQYSRLYLISGVIQSLDNELEVTADGVSGLQVTVDTGRAFVDGFFLSVTDTPAVLSIAPADPVDDRIDAIVVRYDPEGFSASPVPSGQVTLEVLTGTPDPYGPVAPSVTQNTTGVFDIAIATVLVEGGSAQIPPGNVTDTRTFTTQVRDLVGTTAERLALTPLEGTWWFDTDLNEVFRYDGTDWVGLGLAATVAVGTVSDVPFPGPGSVTNVGTPENAILDFELVTGPQGPQGDPGVGLTPTEVIELVSDAENNIIATAVFI